MTRKEAAATPLRSGAAHRPRRAAHLVTLLTTLVAALTTAADTPAANSTVTAEIESALAARRTRDETRLRDARAHGRQSGEERAASARRLSAARTRLRDTEAAIEQALQRIETLDQARFSLGDDLSQVHAVARSAAAEQLARLRHGPLGPGRPAALHSAAELTSAPANLDALRGVWYALFEEIAAAEDSQRFAAPVTFRDGVRRTTPVLRLGAQLLIADGREVLPQGSLGLAETRVPLPVARPGSAVPAETWRYRPPAEARAATEGLGARALIDSGYVGILIGLCGLGGGVIVLAQGARLAVWRRRLARTPPGPVLARLMRLQRAHLLAGERHAGTPRDQVRGRRIVATTDEHLRVVASAAMLLGLLGTVIGLIHTFRSLALYGGTDASLAAAGISHALATTWFGLCVAVPLTLLQAGLRSWRRRIENHLQRRVLRAGPAATPGGARTRPRWHPLFVALYTRLKLVVALPGALAIAVALFLLMQWLVSTPLRAPEQADRDAPLERVDWRPPPPPPPPQTRQSSEQPAPPASALSLTAPALPSVDLPLPAVRAPALETGGTLRGAAGGIALAGAGGEWVTSSGEEAFAGTDLVPIASARPRYPQGAARRGIEGWVELVFVIGADGRVSNIRVLDAEPRGVFENAAAAAMRQWLYAPLYRGGQPVAREATQMFRFSRADIQDLYLHDDRED